MTRPSLSLWKLCLFSALPALLVLAVTAPVYWWFGRQGDPEAEGRALNELAWEATFIERGLPPPVQGPREGYWGSRYKRWRDPDPDTGWRTPEIHIPGLLDVDAHGLQYYQPVAEELRRVLIIGGSAAFGAYASGIATTYYSVIGQELEGAGLPTALTIAAAGAWKSIQELAALEKHLDSVRPEVVVFLNGLNDLTNGGTARALYGEPITTDDGSPWTLQYHAHDYEARLKLYLQVVDAAARLCAQHGAQYLVVLQPSLAERSRLTPIERDLLAGSVSTTKVAAAHRQCYEILRARLPAQLKPRGAHFLDASRAFEGESATTFCDQWHFSDPGHAILGQAIARELKRILELQGPKPRGDCEAPGSSRSGHGARRWGHGRWRQRGVSSTHS